MTSFDKIISKRIGFTAPESWTWGSSPWQKSNYLKKKKKCYTAETSEPKEDSFLQSQGTKTNITFPGCPLNLPHPSPSSPSATEKEITVMN